MPLVAEALATTVILFVVDVVEIVSSIISSTASLVNVVSSFTAYLSFGSPTLSFTLYQPSVI